MIYGENYELWVAKMTKYSISVYAEGCDLKTPERKDLYRLILELKDLFGDAPKRFSQALKVLFFEGRIETYSPTISDDSELSGTRYNDLGGKPYVFICLASPVVSLDFYKGILGLYQDDWLKGGVSDIFSIRVARSHWSDDLIRRISVLLQALDESLGGCRS